MAPVSTSLSTARRVLGPVRRRVVVVVVVVVRLTAQWRTHRTRFEPGCRAKRSPVETGEILVRPILARPRTAASRLLVMLGKGVETWSAESPGVWKRRLHLRFELRELGAYSPRFVVR